MEGDTTPMRVLIVVDCSSGFAAKWMAKRLESTSYARMKVQSDGEQSIEHLL